MPGALTRGLPSTGKSPEDLKLWHSSKQGLFLAAGAAAGGGKAIRLEHHWPPFLPACRKTQCPLLRILRAVTSVSYEAISEKITSTSAPSESLEGRAQLQRKTLALLCACVRMHARGGS